MSKSLRLFMVAILLLTSLFAWISSSNVPYAAAQTADNCLPDGVQPSGAIYRICLPPQWNGDLVVYAHGYVTPDAPIAIPEDQLRLRDGTYLPDLVNSLGYAFATTSYHKNGLAVLPGIADLRELVGLFKSMFPQTRLVYLTGVSEGGLITTLAVEQFPTEFNGGLALCGPVGDFARHVNYVGDFRIVFDYFFPAVLPPSPISIPKLLQDNWDTLYSAKVIQAITQAPASTAQLLSVTNAIFDPNNINTVGETTLGLLWYNVFPTNNAIEVLGGQPFDNWTRQYRGSLDDRALNQGVARFQADPVAQDEIAAHYQTSGKLQVPMVLMHTTGDPIVPYWHERLYRNKIISAGSTALYNLIPIQRYGHCTFNADEVLQGFALLVLKVTNQSVPGVKLLLPYESGFMVYLPAMLRNNLSR